MNIIQNILISIVEGVTEFLPVSSTFHIDLAGKVLGVPHTDFFTSFTIAIQLGAIIAVMILFRHRLLQSPRMIFQLGISFIPVGIVGLLIYPIVKNVFLGNQVLEISALFIGGLVMIYFARQYHTEYSDISEKTDISISFKDLFYLSLWQIVAFIPGVSRSGAIIIGGLVKKIPLHQVIPASFLLAIPTMITATGYDLWKTGAQFTPDQWKSLVLGMIFSGIVAFFVAKWLLRFLQKPNALQIFGWYRVILAVILGVILFI